MCFVINTALRHCNEGAPILTACIFICIRFSFCNLLIMYVFEFVFLFFLFYLLACICVCFSQVLMFVLYIYLCLYLYNEEVISCVHLRLADWHGLTLHTHYTVWLPRKACKEPSTQTVQIIMQNNHSYLLVGVFPK